MGNKPSSNYDLYFYKITFGNTAVDWANKLQCPSGICSTSYASSILSSDSTSIYSFFPFGFTSLLYFLTFSVADGSIVGSWYKSVAEWGYVYGLTAKPQSPDLSITYWSLY